MAALKVLLATEVASELGVTISFSDADGDSVASGLCAGSVVGPVAGRGRGRRSPASRSPTPTTRRPTPRPRRSRVAVTSDAPRVGSLEELAASADLVVRGEVVATERGRVFGEPGGDAPSSHGSSPSRSPTCCAGTAPGGPSCWSRRRAGSRTARR